MLRAWPELLPGRLPLPPCGQLLPTACCASRSCRRSFAWGPAAAALQQLPAPAAGAGEQQQQQRRRERAQLLQQRLPLDPARAALTVCHWPEGCSLAVPGSSGDGDGTGSDAGGAPEQLPAAAAAYDPGFLLPFCCACLRQQLLPPRAFAEAGLLSGGPEECAVCQCCLQMGGFACGAGTRHTARSTAVQSMPQAVTVPPVLHTLACLQCACGAWLPPTPAAAPHPTRRWRCLRRS